MTPGKTKAELEPVIYDKKGIPILPGDTIKMFHYIAAVRREKRYMYKFVQDIVFTDKKTPLLKISHLNLRGEGWHMLMDGKIHDNIEIVQGYEGVKPGYSYRDRSRKQKDSL